MPVHVKPPSRRVALLSGLGIAGARAAEASAAEPLRYEFATGSCRVRLTVEFHDRYFGRGGTFTGSLAIARYEVLPQANGHKVLSLRERVRTIDRDERLSPRPPFDRTVEFRQGVASDIQAFGYRESGAVGSTSVAADDSASPWYYFRQDLYLGAEPFLIIHWKHALDAIRLLDVIPAGRTSLVRG